VYVDERCYLANVDAAVEGPHRLEVFLHALLEVARNVVRAEEVFEVAGLGLVDRSTGVHALDDRRHVTEHQSVHQRYTHTNTHSFYGYSTQLKFIKTGSSKDEHTNNNLYRYSKIHVNIKYSTIKYSRITNTKKIKINK